MGVLLCHLAEPSYPRAPNELGGEVAWMGWFLVALLFLWMWTRAESVRRGLLGLEDPRMFAALRIGFALFTFINFVNLAPYWSLLWADEGLFTLEYAQERLGRNALRGWSPAEGFFDPWAVVNFLWNQPSLFYFSGTPAFVYGYMAVFFLVLLTYGVGAFSRTSGVAAWFLMSGVYERNALYWEGTDTVYRVFFFLLLFARTGHAWSFDNWWRCRRLARVGRLAAPGDADPSKEPVYRLVPSWPKYLFMLQLALLYASTGWVKTGEVWRQGDAFYYALNMDHFYRFEGLTQRISAVLGTNVFRLMTWVTHLWERFFPVVLIGMILKFGIDHRDQPWYRAQQRRWRLWVGRGALLIAYVVVYRLVLVVYPYTVPTTGGADGSLAGGIARLHAIFGVMVPAVVIAWFALARWPVVVPGSGRKLGPVPLPRLLLDPPTLRVWLFGRRVWLLLGLMFHGFLILFMNIGMFPFIMLLTYLAFFDGREVAAMMGVLHRLLRRGRLGHWLGPSRSFVLPGQAAASVRPRGGRISNVVVLGLGVLGAGLLTWSGEAKVSWLEGAGWAFAGLCLAFAVAARFASPAPEDAPTMVGHGPVPAYSAIGRTLALGMILFHGSAIALHLFPSFTVLSQFRAKFRAMHGGWLRGTGTTQSWRMFAPNPPRSNTFMVTVVVEHDGDRWDLRNNAYHHRPNPWIINDRMRKMQRRMVDQGKWYLRHWADYHCRQWYRRTGELPEKIDIDKIITRIPSPEMVAEKGWYDPRKLKPRRVDVEEYPCNEKDALPPWLKERWGVPLTEEDRQHIERETEAAARKWDNRRKSWDRRKDWGGGSESNAAADKPSAKEDGGAGEDGD